MMLNFLEKIATALIKKYKPVVICITGSVGKTSTKDAIAACLSASFTARKTPKNLNNEYGVPISVIGGFKFKEGFWALLNIAINGILQLLINRNFPKILVIEVGAGKIGEIKRVSEWLVADILVVTNLPDNPSHLGVFGSKEKVIEEKKHLADAMTSKGKLFIDVSEKNMGLYTKGYKGKIIQYNSTEVSNFSNYKIIYKRSNNFTVPIGISLDIAINNKKTTLVFQRFLGVQNIKAILIAKLIAEELKCTEDLIVKGLQNYTPEAGRLRILPGKVQDVTVIDDSFNSSPIAVENSLKNFLSINKANSQRRMAVLGDMLNLGTESESIHRTTAIGGFANVDVLITVGKISQVWQEYSKNTLKLNKHFKNSTNAARYIETIIEPGDLILFKGGHLTRLEKAVNLLTQSKKENLVRQEDYWQKPEFELFNEQSDE